MYGVACQSSYSLFFGALEILPLTQQNRENIPQSTLRQEGLGGGGGAPKAIRENEQRSPDDKNRVALGCLPDLLPILNGTGWRISAVCQLRCQDLRLRDKAKARPYGAIRWPSDTDKTDKESRPS